MTHLRCILIAAAIAGCSGQGQGHVTIIGRHRGPLDPSDSGFIGGMNYDPTDAPVAWTRAGDLFVAHREEFSEEDVFSTTCAGSGVYTLRPGNGPARELAVGEPVCRAENVSADPQGEWIVYSLRFAPNNSGLLKQTLVSRRIDTLATGCPIALERPAVSSDGHSIAAEGACQRRNEGWGIYLLRADGTALRRLAGRRGAEDRQAAWSPDGEHLAVVRRSDTDQPLSDSIIVVRSKSGEQHTVSKGDSPAWSPDGQWIAYLVNHSRTRDDVTIELIHPDGSGERELFRSHERGTYSRGWGPHPEGLPEGPLVWSPDSKAVAFSRRYDRGASIWLVEIATGAERQVTAPDRQ